MNGDPPKSETNHGTTGPPPPPATTHSTHGNGEHVPPEKDFPNSGDNEPSKPFWKGLPFWGVVFSGLLVINAFVTSCFLIKQYEVQRQQLVGTQAANVALRLDVFATDGLRVVFDRRGVVAAREVRFEFTAVRKAIPSLEEIERPIQNLAYEEVIHPEQPYPPKEYSLPGFTPSVLEAIRRTEQTVMVTGQFSYDNGFGDIRSESVCVYWLSGIPNRTTDQGGANEFVDCDNFPVRLSNVLEARKEEQAGQ